MNSTPQPPVIFLAFANEYRKSTILDVPPKNLAEIARHIIEIGDEWRWL